MSVRNSVPRDFIPHGCIPADLYRKVMVEVENVIDDPNHVQDVALWIDGIHECKFIARDDEQFRWATDSACDLMESTERDLFGGDTYVFVTVLDETDYYFGWVRYNSNEVVALHKSDCDSLQPQFEIGENIEEHDGGRKVEYWLVQGRTLTYRLSVYETTDSPAVDGSIMVSISELDTESMTAREIADRVNADLEVWDKYVESYDIEPNYELLPPDFDVAGYKMCVIHKHSSQRITSEEAFEKVKRRQYAAAGIDLDLVEIVEDLWGLQDQPDPSPAKRRRR